MRRHERGVGQQISLCGMFVAAVVSERVHTRANLFGIRFCESAHAPHARARGRHAPVQRGVACMRAPSRASGGIPRAACARAATTSATVHGETRRASGRVRYLLFFLRVGAPVGILCCLRARIIARMRCVLELFTIDQPHTCTRDRYSVCLLLYAPGRAQARWALRLKSAVYVCACDLAPSLSLPVSVARAGIHRKTSVTLLQGIDTILQLNNTSHCARQHSHCAGVAARARITQC